MKLKKNLIIGITGRHQSGKDTVLDNIQRILFDAGFGLPIRLSMNVSALETVAEVFECDRSFIENNKAHPIIRSALEFTGNEYIPMHKNAHQTTIRLKEDIEKFSSEEEGRVFLISSVYRVFEAEFIQKELGGFIIYLERKYYMDGRKDSYAEEAELMPLESEITKIVPDFYLHNDNTIERLAFLTRDMMTQLINSEKMKEHLTRTRYV